MKRREERLKRRREDLPLALSALINLIPQGANSRKFLEDTYGTLPEGGAVPTDPEDCDQHAQPVDDEDAVIEGKNLERLVEDIGAEVCPDGALDIVRVARRGPRSRSSVQTGVHIAELCFALNQATSPVSVHERRRGEGRDAGPLDEDAPLVRYYKGARFAAITRGENPSSRMIEVNDAVDSAEWEAFMRCVETPLPMTLRVHRNEQVLERAALQLLDGDAEVAAVVRPVQVMPASLGMYSCSNHDYHTNARAEAVCRTLHAASAVSFQEVVSAIPVLVLAAEAHHSVLELCAAPGSKTLQTLDKMLKGGWSREVVKGVMVANEKDRVKATQTLPARLKRYHAPNVMCTRCDGMQWPRLYISGETRPDPSADEAVLAERRFDRVVCDVPCSGDGTLRKERSVATTWSAGYVKSLVPTQKALLRRGLDLLNDGGILVYSTCSMNPREDEEVVCAGLELFGDCVELVDVNKVLRQRGVQLHSSGGILSPNVDGLSKPTLPLQYDGSRVLRVLPHRDNTGGFFVAAFRKLKQPEWTSPTVVHRKLNQWTKGKLWAPISVDDPNWKAIATFYGFDRTDQSSFSYYTGGGAGEEAAEEAGGLVPVYHLNPNGAASRRIVLATRGLADMIFHTRPYKGPGVEVVSVGARAFETYDRKFLAEAACRWRAVVECASFLAPRCTARKLLLCADVHRQLLTELLQSGYVLLRDNARAILADQFVNSLCSSASDRYPFVKPGPLMEAFALSEGEEGKGDGAASAAELLTGNVHVGGVLLGIAKDAADAGEGGKGAWFVSATLSCNKLELAIDVSLRVFGLMTYLGIVGSTDAKDVKSEEGQVPEDDAGV